ncbi:collagen alpha-6(VI) chain [Biomphalaria pfeifferi]|uniref:Collagen alpha-6(VI) chain n=1 Tax=Biomphalaria pfeifferi TaxID=112525 RepID=A0AAD8BJ04_BIOPF|nr:collagen alpha-6(VI) chain [Biomphalaria pfeifferi]
MWRKIFLSLLAGCWLAEWSSAHTSNDRDIQILANAVSVFSYDLYRRIGVKAVNVIYSPLSAHTVLSLAYMGAMGNTEHQMKNILRLKDLPSPHEAFHALLHNITEVEDVKVFVANGMWLNPQLRVRPEYQRQVSTLYNAASETIDFKTLGGPERPINEWIANQTKNQITSFMLPSTISQDIQMILINTLFFNGTWESPFDEYLTHKNSFQLSLGNKIDIDFMRQTATYQVKMSAVENVDVIRMPFTNKRFAFYIALPRSYSGLRDFEMMIVRQDYERINGLFTDMKTELVDLMVPKFKITTSVNLNRGLKNLGMTDAFGPLANFHGISENQLFLSEVLQKATIEVTEKGTLAVAASAVTLSNRLGFLGEPLKFNVDHPFMFFLRDDLNGLILFQGKYTNPTVKESSEDRRRK